MMITLPKIYTVNRSWLVVVTTLNKQVVVTTKNKQHGESLAMMLDRA
jgi:hypothetical protein